MSQEGTESVAERLRAFFFGRDVFISYSYDDSAYAEAMAVALQERKFSVFLGAWGASPGEELSPAVSSAARQSRMLVVIATPQSRASGPVNEEIGYFADHHRPVVPVDVGLGIRDTTTDWPALAGLDVIHESAALDPLQPLPSAHVLARITNSAKFMRQTARLTRFVAAVFVAVLVLIAVAVGVAAWSRAVVRDAQERASQAEERELTARGNTVGAQVLASAAGLKAFDTALRSRGAEQQARLAEDNRRVAAALTEREASIGSSIRMANEAAALLEMEPARLPSAALLAVQSVRLLHERGTRALAADAIIRETLRLLPPIIDHVRFRVEHPMYVVAATPDARWLLYREENHIDVIDTDSGERRRLLPPPGMTIKGTRSALSDDGSTVAAIGTEGDGPTRAGVVVWRKGEAEPRILDVAAPVSVGAMSGDGRFVAYRSGSRLTVLSLEDGTVESAEYRGDVESIRFSRSGDLVAVSGSPPVVWPWRARQPPVEVPSTDYRIFLNPADESIVAGFDGLQVTVRNWRDVSVLSPEPIRIHGAYTGITFSSDGSMIAWCDVKECHLARWGTQARTFSFPADEPVQAIVPTPFGAVVAYANGTVEFVSLYTETVTGRTVHDGVVLTIAARDDGSVRSISTTGAMTSSPWWIDWASESASDGIAAIAPDGGTIVIAEPPRRDNTPARLTIHTDTDPTFSQPSVDFDPTAVAIGFDGALIVGSAAGAVLRWPSAAVGGSAPSRLAQAPGPITAIAAGRGGRVAWAAGTQVWATGSAAPLMTSSPVTTLAFGRDDGQLAAGTKEGKVVLWDRGTVTTFVRRHPIESLAFSADGRFIAATAHPEPAVVWPVHRAGVAYEMPGDPATAVAFHPTDGTIASGGHNGVVHVWSDWRKPRPLEVARFGGGRYLRAARFSEDGRYLVTVPASGHGARRIWKSEDLIAVTCSRLEPLRPSGELAAYDIVCGAD